MNKNYDANYIEELVNELIVNDRLNDREKEIIKYRYSLFDYENISLREMSKKFKLPMKKMLIEVEKTEKKVFNLLKNKV